MKGGFIIFIFVCSSLLGQSILSAAVDTIFATQSLKDGETLVSEGGSFELGFFNPSTSRRVHRYFGIWYKKIYPRTVVWVANGDRPLTDFSGVFKVNGKEGKLVLLDSRNATIWSSNSSGLIQNPVAQLLDNGNLVVRHGNDTSEKSFVWQSFECSSDTFLPGVKLGMNKVTGSDFYFRSWKSLDDPSPGEYTNKLDPSGFPQVFLRKGSVIVFRSGPWNGLRYSGMPNLEQNSIYTFKFVISSEGIYYEYNLVNSSVVSRMVLTPNGELQRLNWVDRTKEWVLYVSAMMDDCDRYALCGSYGSCNINGSPPCGCLQGFVPKFPGAWNASDWTDGCVRSVRLDCQNGDGFIRHSGVKLPDTRNSWVNMSMNLKECERMCLSKCNCTAYANSDIRDGGSGCLLWFDELIDIRFYTKNGQDLYVRMAASELESLESSNRKKRTVVIVASVLPISMVLLVLCLAIHTLKRKKVKREVMGERPESPRSSNTEEEDLDLPLFELATIYIATNHFSINNKIGQGGFGHVYKGKLKNGQEVAVKRLSKSSKQGFNEFTSEVNFIAKLQHRNLVKLLGCCIEDDEKMLIYEYMPNKSLDSFIFDRTRSKLLDWPTRFHIINGIARGLLYLHQDSRLRIIHRDLKASNILLDDEMNPKISDFGTARTFGKNEIEGKTSRVVGTYGYMSPEYAIDGLFSVKSDVFSFGVLVLEILSSKRNRGFQNPDHELNLLGHVWKLFIEDKPLEIFDLAYGSQDHPEVLRCIHVGLLCVQQNPEDRPTMSLVLMMLNSDSALPQPKQPGFFTRRNLRKVKFSNNRLETSSTSEMTLTSVEPR